MVGVAVGEAIWPVPGRLSGKLKALLDELGSGVLDDIYMDAWGLLGEDPAFAIPFCAAFAPGPALRGGADMVVTELTFAQLSDEIGVCMFVAGGVAGSPPARVEDEDTATVVLPAIVATVSGLVPLVPMSVVFTKAVLESAVPASLALT